MPQVRPTMRLAASLKPSDRYQPSRPDKIAAHGGLGDDIARKAKQRPNAVHTYGSTLYGPTNFDKPLNKQRLSRLFNRISSAKAKKSLIIQDFACHMQRPEARFLRCFVCARLSRSPYVPSVSRDQSVSLCSGLTSTECYSSSLCAGPGGLDQDQRPRGLAVHRLSERPKPADSVRSAMGRSASTAPSGGLPERTTLVGLLGTSAARPRGPSRSGTPVAELAEPRS